MLEAERQSFVLNYENQDSTVDSERETLEAKEETVAMHLSFLASFIHVG